jgi:hypothetical protein
MMEEEDIQIQTQEREIAQKLLTRYIGDVAEKLNAFCINHLGDLPPISIVPLCLSRGTVLLVYACSAVLHGGARPSSHAGRGHLPALAVVS